MNSYFIRFLNAEYETAKRANASFSKRAFAKKLGIDSALLIALLAGRRKPTVNIGKKILNRLPVENPFLEEALLLSLVDDRYPNFQPLPEANLKVKENPDSWIDHAVWVLLKLPPAKNLRAEIATNLGLSQRQLTPSLDRLERQGLVKLNRQSVVLLDDKNYVFRGYGDKALDKMQTEYMMKAIQVYQKNPIGPLKVVGHTFTCNVGRLREASKRMSEFCTKLANFLEDKDSKVVYRLNADFFPLTKLSAEEEARILGRE